MIIANNATYKSFLSSYGLQNSKLQTSMSRLSSGQRLIQPGDAPADLGISERFRAQIRSTEAASGVIQNAINMFQSTDTWLQEIHNILDRMAELATSAADGSKNDGDRANLELEFQQLKTEIKRISTAGKYNGLAVNSNAAYAVYNAFDHQIQYSQADGSEVRTLEANLKDGNAAANGIQYAFESSATGFIGDYMFSDDGKYLLYVAQKSVGTLSAQKTLMRLDIETDTLTTVALGSAGGTSANRQARLFQDDEGRIWVSNPSTASASNGKQFNLNLLDVEAMSLDAGGSSSSNSWGGSVKMASSMSNFSVHKGYAYYIERSGNVAAGKMKLVKQDLSDASNKETLLYDLSGASINLDAGENYTISADGQYLAFEDEDNATKGKVIVYNLKSGEKATLNGTGTRTNSVVGLAFDKNNNLVWTDTGSSSDANAIYSVEVKSGDTPSFGDIKTVRSGNHGEFGVYNSTMGARNVGLSVGGGSPAASYTFQIGPDGGMDVSFKAADVQLVKLGISDLGVGSQESAVGAIDAIKNAVNTVSNQRAILGSQVSRMNFVYAANEGYGSNIAQAESRIRDVDIAAETSKLTNAQIMAQTGISIMAQSNAARQNILRLLQ